MLVPPAMVLAIVITFPIPVVVAAVCAIVRYNATGRDCHNRQNKAAQCNSEHVHGVLLPANESGVIAPMTPPYTLNVGLSRRFPGETPGTAAFGRAYPAAQMGQPAPPADRCSGCRRIAAACGVPDSACARCGGGPAQQSSLRTVPRDRASVCTAARRVHPVDLIASVPTRAPLRMLS